MALRMPRPFAHKTGVFFLNVRVPQDLLGKLRRTRVTLPVGDMLVTISVSDKVFLSLQTKDPNLARIRFAAPEGPPFAGDKAQKPDASRTPAEQRASELTAWVRANVTLDPGVSPSHGWRHTFISTADDVGISKRMANTITGHNQQKDASDGYYTPKTAAMRRAMDLYPRYAAS